ISGTMRTRKWPRPSLAPACPAWRWLSSITSSVTGENAFSRHSRIRGTRSLAMRVLRAIVALRLRSPARDPKHLPDQDEQCGAQGAEHLEIDPSVLVVVIHDEDVCAAEQPERNCPGQIELSPHSAG